MAILIPPTHPAARESLPVFRISTAILNPRPTSPTTFAAGTGTSWYDSSTVFDPLIPILYSGLPDVNPGRSRVTRNAVIFSRPSGIGVLAKVWMTWAYPPFVHQILLPLRTQTSRVGSYMARLFSACASEPEEGSVRA